MISREATAQAMNRTISKKIGRPTLYKDKYVQMMEDYFNIPVGTHVIPE